MRDKSPIKQLNHETSTVSNWRELNRKSVQETADELKNRSQSPTFGPQPMTTDSNHMVRTFRNYEAYKRDLSPNGSKVEYQHFLKNMTKDKNIYDSNISGILDHHRKVIAYRNREQFTRAQTLCVNEDTNKEVMRTSNDLKNAMAVNIDTC